MDKEFFEQLPDLSNTLKKKLADDDYSTLYDKLSNYTIAELLQIKACRMADALNDQHAARLIHFIGAELERKQFHSTERKAYWSLVIAGLSIVISIVSIFIRGS